MTTPTDRNEFDSPTPRVAHRHGLLARLLFFTMDLLYGRRLTLQKLRVWTSAFAQDHGTRPTLAALFRQIARDEAAHSDGSLRRMSGERLQAGAPLSIGAPVLIFGLSFGLLTCTTAGMPNGPADARARARVEQLVSSGELPGIQYEVVGPEGVLFSSATGVRDVASGAPMEATTVQMAYSTTKIITAVAVLQLVEGGRMALDAPLSRYYAAHPYGDAVTVRQLLAHTSGIPDPMPLDWFAVAGHPFDRDQELRRLLDRHPRLRHPPGQRYGYSNLGYWLLEKAIEGAASQDYAAYVEEHVFAPLDIPPAEARFASDGPGPMAVGHARRFNPVTWVLELLTPASYWSRPHGRWSRSAHVVPYGRAYGGLLVTARGLGRVLQDLTKADSRLLRAPTKEALFQLQPTGKGKPAGTLGWVVGEVAGERYFGKQGGGLGFHGNLRIYPSRGIATVLLANRTEISAGPIDARSDQLDTAFLSP